MDEAGSGPYIRDLVASSTSPRRGRKYYRGRLSWGISKSCPGTFLPGYGQRPKCLQYNECICFLHPF